jgi:DNA polymerase I-like protein with 3'-5' exonuclease and polymerase domains
MAIIELWPTKETGLTVAVDTETTGLFTDDPCAHCPLDVHITIVSYAWEGGSAAIPFALGEDDSKNAGEETWEALLKWLSKQRLIMHNAKFDLHQLARGAPNGWRGRDLVDSVFWDTSLAAWLMWPAHSPSLKTTAERLWGPDAVEAAKRMKEALLELPRGQQHDFWRIPWSRQGVYAKADAELTLRLFNYQTDEATGYAGDDDETYDLAHYIDRELEVAKVLYKMEERGIGFKADEAREIAVTLEAEKDYIEKQAPFKLTRNEALKFWEAENPPAPLCKECKGVGKIYTLVSSGGPSDEDVEDARRSGGMLRAVGEETFEISICPSCKGKPRKKSSFEDIQFEETPGGKPSLNHKGMAIAAAAKLTYAKKFLRYLDIDRALSLWFGPEGWPSKIGQDGRLRTDYRQITANYHGVPSGNGRFSSSRINLMAIPKAEKTVEKGLPDVRALFVPRKGYELIGLDLSNAELRIAASLSGCEKMIDAFEAGGDPHTNTTKKLFDITEKDKRWDTVRKHAKTATFAILYGTGAGTLVETFAEAGHDFTVIETKRLIREFDKEYPELRATMKEAERRADDRGYITLISGRRRYFTDGEATWKAFNTAVQGGVAEFMKDAMLWVETNFPGALLLQIHDEFVLELPQPGALARGQKIADELAAQATELFQITMVMKAKLWNKEA